MGSRVKRSKANVGLKGTHELKLGAVIDQKRKDGTKYRGPAFTRAGMCIYRGKDIAMDLMSALGCDDEDKIKEHVNKGRDGTPGYLPSKVAIYLDCSSTKEPDGSWNHKNYISGYTWWDKAYVCQSCGHMFTKKGANAQDGIACAKCPNCGETDKFKWHREGMTTCWCSGDGENASRKQVNGVPVHRECNPVGCEGVTSDNVCPESASKKCRRQTRIKFRLAQRRSDAPDDLPNYLAYGPMRAAAGSEIVYQSGSFDVGDQIVEELDRGSDRTNGRLYGQLAYLEVSFKKRTTPKGPATLPSVRLALDEEQLAANDAAQVAILQIGAKSFLPVISGDPVDPPPIDVIVDGSKDSHGDLHGVEAMTDEMVIEALNEELSGRSDKTGMVFAHLMQTFSTRENGTNLTSILAATKDLDHARFTLRAIYAEGEES